MEIRVNTDNLQSALQLLKSKTAEMESAIQAAESSISPLRSLQSPRIQRDMESWDDIKSVLSKSLESMLETLNELTRAAIANETANN